MSEIRGRHPEQDQGRVDTRLFGIPQNFDAHMGEMDDALRAGDTERLIRLSQKTQENQHAILRKGGGAIYLTRLVKMGDAIAHATSGHETLHQVTHVDELRDVIKNSGVPVQFFVQAAEAQYFLRQDVKMRHVLDILLALDKTEMDVVTRAQTYNDLGSLLARQGDGRQAFKLNDIALKLFKSIETEDKPDARFIALKVMHGRVWDQSLRNPSREHITTLEKLMDERRAMGDMAHVGRTELDMARIAYKLGERDEALVRAMHAHEGLEEAQYTSAAVDALKLIGEIRGEQGEHEKKRRVWVKGFGEGTRLGPVREVETKEMKEYAEPRMPAYCAIEIIPGKLLLSLSEDGSYELPIAEHADEQGHDGGRKQLLTDLANRLRFLYKELSAEELSEDYVYPLSRKKDGVYEKDGYKNEGGEETSVYKIELREDTPLAELFATDSGILDKMKKLGYGVVSIDEMDQWKDKLDEPSRIIVERLFTT